MIQSRRRTKLGDENKNISQRCCELCCIFTCGVDINVQSDAVDIYNSLFGKLTFNVFPFLHVARIEHIEFSETFRQISTQHLKESTKLSETLCGIYLVSFRGLKFSK